MNEVVQQFISLIAGEVMEPRFSFSKDAPEGYKAMLGIEHYVQQCGLEKSLLSLIKVRASQINGCAFCIDMHWKESRALREGEARLYSLDAWRECPYYSDRERAALSWTEALTLIASGHVADSVYEEVHPHFTDKELADLSLAIAAINAWNRVLIAARAIPGTYIPTKQHGIERTQAVNE
jgi:AhpD family alkylhydroperoxidase